MLTSVRNVNLIISNEMDISPPPSLVTGEGDGLSFVYLSQSSGLIFSKYLIADHDKSYVIS